MQRAVKDWRPAARAEGYELLSRFRRKDLGAIYQAVATRGPREDEHCPRVFEEGIRLLHLVEEFENTLKEKVRDRVPFTKIAACCVHFFIHRQPLKNCNHRTGLGVMNWVLNSFGFKFSPKSQKDVLGFLKEFEKRGMSVKEVEEWIAQNISAI